MLLGANKLIAKSIQTLGGEVVEALCLQAEDSLVYAKELRKISRGVDVSDACHMSIFYTPTSRVISSTYNFSQKSSQNLKSVACSLARHLGL